MGLFLSDWREARPGASEGKKSPMTLRDVNNIVLCLVIPPPLKCSGIFDKGEGLGGWSALGRALSGGSDNSAPTVDDTDDPVTTILGTDGNRDGLSVFSGLLLPPVGGRLR